MASLWFSSAHAQTILKHTLSSNSKQIIWLGVMIFRSEPYSCHDALARAERYTYLYVSPIRERFIAKHYFKILIIEPYSTGLRPYRPYLIVLPHFQSNSITHKLTNRRTIRLMLAQKINPTSIYR